MKKILLLGIVASLFTLGASAQSRKNDFDRDNKGPDRHHMTDQRNDRSDYRTHSLTRGEKAKMRHNSAEYQRAKHRSYRDGKLSHREQRNLHKMKKHNRRDAHHFMHNDRRRGR